MLRQLLLIVFLLILPNWFPTSFADSETGDHFSVGALILEEIEPDFTKSPIFLNPDENFKETNKQKLLRAISHLEEALETDPSGKIVFYLLGLAYSFAHDLNMEGAWQKSVKYLSKAIELDPNDHKSHMVLGKNYMDAGQFDESFQEYEKVNGYVPNGFALRNMAFVRMAQGRTDEAQALLGKYIEHNPQDKDAPKILSALKEGKFQKVGASR